MVAMETEGGGGESVVETGGEEDEMQELMQNKEFLESVLSSLPGVNTEEALQNLQEMTKVAEEQQQKSKEKKEEVGNAPFEALDCLILYLGQIIEKKNSHIVLIKCHNNNELIKS